MWVNENGYPVGPARRPVVSLRPVKQDGRTVAWDAFFELNRVDRHYYLSAFGLWEEGNASYNFHVKTGS